MEKGNENLVAATLAYDEAFTALADHVGPYDDALTVVAARFKSNTSDPEEP